MGFAGAVLWAAASFAGVTGTVDGKPFTGVSAIGFADAGHPDRVLVAVADEPISCGAKPAPTANAVVLTFARETGAVAASGDLVLARSKGRYSLADGQAVLTEFPTVTGGVGTVRIDAFAAKEGSVAGDFEFVLCELPDVAKVVSTATIGGLPAIPVATADVIFLRPVEWQVVQNFSGQTEFASASGQAQFTMAAQCAGDCTKRTWEAAASQWVGTRLEPYRNKSGYSLAVLRNGAMDGGVWETYYTITSVLGTTAYRDVAVWSPKESTLVLCTGEAPVASEGELAVLTDVCKGAVAVPQARRR